MSQTVRIIQHQGHQDYMGCHKDQKSLLNHLQTQAEYPDTLLVLVHAPCYTIGKNPTLRMFRNLEAIQRLKVPIYDNIGREGSITFHGPGQLILYALRDLQRAEETPEDHKRHLEGIAIATLEAFGLPARRRAPLEGVWIDKEKIAAVGIGIINRRYTWHGMALNVNTNLQYFDHIHPCGIEDRNFGVTSMQQLLERKIPMLEVQTLLERMAVLKFDYAISNVLAPPQQKTGETLAPA